MDDIFMELLAEATRVRWPERPSTLDYIYDEDPLTCHETIRIVPLSEIEIENVWAPNRLAAIRDWGSKAARFADDITKLRDRRR